MTRQQAINLYINKGGKVRRWVISIIQRWDSKKSITENANRMKLRYDQARNIAENYELNYKKIFNNRKSALVKPKYKPTPQEYHQPVTMDCEGGI